MAGINRTFEPSVILPVFLPGQNRQGGKKGRVRGKSAEAARCLALVNSVGPEAQAADCESEPFSRTGLFLFRRESRANKDREFPCIGVRPSGKARASHGLKSGLDETPHPIFGQRSPSNGSLVLLNVCSGCFAAFAGGGSDNLTELE